MNLKLKAWMIYLIAIAVIPSLIIYGMIPTLIYAGYFTRPFELTEPLSYYVGELTFDVAFYGGILTGMYYFIKNLYLRNQKELNKLAFDNEKKSDTK